MWSCWRRIGGKRRWWVTGAMDDRGKQIEEIVDLTDEVLVDITHSRILEQEVLDLFGADN